ncbi:MAG: hypothetical protein OXH13_02690 [Chloroflexi bacterium]|nr:hypothetical protein [Chloroflexota bacterium]MCY3696930.1 hypothetical protein [Chloroflexota bacterium]MXX80337.1 hypothetical protein [Chloroflexota bacterium]MYF21652.1 hypothetical protein [Chloroflexota bacterium]
MLRRLAMVGLATPLVAIIGALIYLFAFGTSAPTFDAGSQQLAVDHTVLRLSESPDAALVVPDEPPESAAVVVILADDQRHIWSAVQDLGLLDQVEPYALALLIAPGVEDAVVLSSLVERVVDHVPVELSVLAAFDGAPIRRLCDDWERVVVVGPAASCGNAVSLSAGEGLAARIAEAVQAMRIAEVTR